jgi:ATP-dependent Clp protease adaptor protein ClpS
MYINNFFIIKLGADNQDSEWGGDSAVALEESKPKLKKPPLYRVVIFNDDYTPMEFVVSLLGSIFGMGYEDATRVMLKVHTEGKAVCAIYIRDIAETKAQQTREYARTHEHPLRCEIEPIDDESN